MTSPSKRLAVFFDGTDNRPKDRTNVWRAHELMNVNSDDGIPQRKVYIPGVGTDIGEIVRGSIFGKGISRKICEGYEWLSNNYTVGAEIFIFGFSRGAFAARSLIQMLACCGLTDSSHLYEWSALQAFDRYDSITRQDGESILPLYQLKYLQKNPEKAPAGWRPTPEEKRLLDENLVREVSIRMAGLWDTVGAIGKDALKNTRADSQKAAAHNVCPAPIQHYGFHALAIDEHRPMFEATLWRQFVEHGREVETMDRYSGMYEQRWFAGAHSDVGGGYGEDDVPNLSLAWILGKATDLGLCFSSSVVVTPQAIRAPLHDSFEAFAGGVLSIWDKVLPGDQRNYREIDRKPKPSPTVTGQQGRLRTINETIDQSVIQRWNLDPTYRPPGLIDYFRRNPKKLPKDPQLAQQTKPIYANQFWNETGVFLRAHTPYHITVLPGVGEPLRDANYFSPSIEGVEWDSLAHTSAAIMHGKRKDDANWFALIGTIDKKVPWIIKPDSEFIAPVSGQLLCYFNDVQLKAFYTNNSGWIVLKISEKI